MSLKPLTIFWWAAGLVVIYFVWRQIGSAKAAGASRQAELDSIIAP